MKRLTLIGMTILPLALAFCAGCLRLGPTYEPPGLGEPLPKAYEQAGGQAQALTLPQDDQWWKVFGDAKLNRLVEDAFTRNPSIKQAAAAVLEVAARYGQARAARYPSLNLNGEAEKTQTIKSSAVSARLSPRRTESYNLSLAAAFELDLWGRLARGEEAARADLLLAEENRRTVVQSIIAEVVTSYLSMQSVERRLEVSRKSLEAYRKSLELVGDRYRRGLVDVLDFQQARRTLAQAKAAVPSLRLELGRAQQTLTVLTGRYPRVAPARVLAEDYFPDLAPVPAGLPSQLLQRRPDLRASEAKLKGLNARVGVALAARFPTIRLTGGWGYASSDLNSLITPASEFWSLAAGIMQPLFDAGLLEDRQREAEARLEQGVAEYAKTVLQAFGEVEGALLARREHTERRQLLLEAVREARGTQEAAQNRYLRGLSDYLAVLEAQRTRFSLEDTLVLHELAILTNRVTLHRALGGGWDQPAASPLPHL